MSLASHSLNYLNTWVQGDAHYYDFVLKKSNFTRLCSTKSMLLTVNESFPGLVIRIHRDDKVKTEE
ncbi:unnamed protein product, partial [Vitis vinifera]